MSVDHGHRHVPAAQQLLDGPDIVAIFQDVGSKGVPIMPRAGFGIPAFWTAFLGTLGKLASLILVLSSKPTYSEGTAASQETLG